MLLLWQVLWPWPEANHTMTDAVARAIVAPLALADQKELETSVMIIRVVSRSGGSTWQVPAWRVLQPLA